jgi:hypothetical protein
MMMISVKCSERLADQYERVQKDGLECTYLRPLEMHDFQD